MVCYPEMLRNDGLAVDNVTALCKMHSSSEAVPFKKCHVGLNCAETQRRIQACRYQHVFLLLLQLTGLV